MIDDCGHLLHGPLLTDAYFLTSVRILAGTQVGNDFLPHIPSLDIYDNPSGLELLLTVYKQLLPDIGHLAADGAVNPQKLQALLQRVARDEGPSFDRRAVRAL